ncbi:MAG: hypothetical protein ACFFAN_08650 [Promethearchaeota archaeon]
MAKFWAYIGLFFLVITIIGLGLIIFGVYIILSYNEPVPMAIYSTILGIILLPIGLIFTIVFFYQSYSEKKRQ